MSKHIYDPTHKALATVFLILHIIQNQIN
jgi:hypothetical protein